MTAATSSRHMPITYDDIAEHTPDAILARLLEERPDIGELVLKANENRAQAIEAAEAAERAERERKDRKTLERHGGRGEGCRGGTGTQGDSRSRGGNSETA
ncbi:hypothetical protein RHMOL_Rhmol01G0221600 [Rhododendron molle]|uniref:Uncharacterized protein n=1 Tax=Rhododendron molle TaxID=49168 RepID=A0ACC0Q3T7_RHOML|nr:hypothetical protein RHMOL_Rhmol01G0221600 [Rhododendron molle]